MDNEVKEPAPKYNYISPEDYLEMERASDTKHEYFKGEVFAMSGASTKHVLITRNLNVQIAPFLRGKKRSMLGSDLRIHIPENTLYTYPDFSIICGELETTDQEKDTVIRPTALIEILSKSTRNYDRGTKFLLYRSIPTLQEYILVDSTQVSIEIFRRQADNTWILAEYKTLDEKFDIRTIDLTLSLKDVYEDIFFD